MSKTLEDRLRDARAQFGKVDAALLRRAGDVPREVDEQFRAVSAFAADIEHWLGMLQARGVARQLLTDLENEADADDTVALGASRAKYQHVRLIGVQAYLATKWALADRLVGMVSRVLCIRSSLNDPKKTPQLVSHFLGKNTNTETAAVAFYSIRHAYGWPIGISYALRNHFVHDGGQVAGTDFFDGPTASSGFSISADGWLRIEERAKSYGVDSIHRRVSTWPTTPRDDLRHILDVCERETDDALGVLVGTASQALLTHVAYMLGED